MTRTQKGLAAAICSNILFAALFLYSSWMQPMSGTDVFMWRMVAMLLGLLALLSLTRSWRQTTAFAQSLGKSPKRWLWLLLPTPILASQLWLFMWAQVNGLRCCKFMFGDYFAQMAADGFTAAMEVLCELPDRLLAP